MKPKMNKATGLLAILGVFLVASCSKELDEIDFVPPVQIQFSEGGDSSIVDIGKGVMEYTATINVQSSGSLIRLFEIYSADPKTGARDTLISSTVHVFDNPGETYSTTYTVPDLTANKCVKVVVTDTLEQVYEKNLLLRISPAVLFSEVHRVETAESYYGSYYATWLSGRVYMRDTEHKAAIDFSLGEISRQAEETTTVPALVNPAKRAEYGLLTTSGLQATKFAPTNLTVAEYNQITQVDAGPIASLPDPVYDTVGIEPGKVYQFKTENGKKGLVNVTGVTAKTGTIETADGQWKEETTYHEVALTTKTAIQ